MLQQSECSERKLTLEDFKRLNASPISKSLDETKKFIPCPRHLLNFMSDHCPLNKGCGESPCLILPKHR